MGIVGGGWIVFVDGLDPALLARRMFSMMGSFPLLAIPLFTMIGILAERSGLLPNLVTWLQMLLGRFKGGLLRVDEKPPGIEADQAHPAPAVAPRR